MIALDPPDFGLPQNRPTWYYSVGGALQPDWAQHFVDVLRGPILNLKSKVGEQLRLVLWSDCVGECTEGTAGKQAADVLMKEADIKFPMKLHAGSDCARHCMKLVQRSFEPTPFADDIFKRDFDAGTFECTLCGQACTLPRAGVDIYWCCFPCGPWSKRGSA